MAVRHSWEGFLQFSLISIPVRAYSAVVSGQDDTHFHQIHRGCGARIRYKKVCEVHGEINKNEITSGYEYQKNMHVEVDPGDIKAMKAKKDNQIRIETFAASGAIEPIHFGGQIYYLAPQGAAGQKAYDVFLQVMQEKHRMAVAEIVLSGHERQVAIRAIKGILTMTVLLLDNEVKQPTEFADGIGHSTISPGELKLAEQLVEASTGDIDLSRDKDKYSERVRELVDAKLAGVDVEAPSEEKVLPVTNLLKALRKSVKMAGATEQKTSKSHRKPRRKAS